jgi:putative transposase
LARFVGSYRDEGEVMPRPVPQPVRLEIVERHQAGEPLTVVAEELALSYRTVYNLWERFRKRGLSGLAADYSRCGQGGPRFPAHLVEAALALKRAHSRWGAGLIRVQLAEQYPGARLPSERTLQVWFRAAGLQPARSRSPTGCVARGKVAHAVWELDAKEEIKLADGSRTVAFSLVDEASRAVLSVALFPSAQSGPSSGGAGAELAEGAAVLLGTARSLARR